MFLFFHKLLMILATLCIIAGVSAAVFFRHNRYWLKVHKSFNTISGVFLSAGVAMAITAIWQQNGEHLDSFHPLAGSITYGFVLISLFLGFYQFQVKNKIQAFKTVHRWLGRLSVLSLVVALISGLTRAGII